MYAGQGGNYLPEVFCGRIVGIHCFGCDADDGDVPVVVEEGIMAGDILSEFSGVAVLACKRNKHGGTFRVGLRRDESRCKYMRARSVCALGTYTIRASVEIGWVISARE
jgi:hypothetical protein